MLRKPSFLFTLLGAVVSASVASGAGFRFGAYEVQSQVGQPLRLAIDVLPDSGELSAIPCLRVLGDPYSMGSAGRTAAFKFAPAESGQTARITLVGSEPIVTPVVRLTLETGCVETSRVDFDLSIPPEAYAADRAPVEAKPEPVVQAKKKPRSKKKKTK